MIVGKNNPSAGFGKLPDDASAGSACAAGDEDVFIAEIDVDHKLSSLSKVYNLNMEKISLDDLIKMLQLTPLTGEGGMIGQPYVSDEFVKDGTFQGRKGDRPVCATIYYALNENSFSCMHRLTGDEIWYYHYGPALKMLLIYPDGHYEIKKLGMDLKNGERPQVTVPRGTWQGSLQDEPGDFTLVSTSMAPRYMDSDFEAGTYEELKKYLSEKDFPLLKKLTAEPVFR